MAQTKAQLLMKIQELESIIWDGTRQLAAMEAALKQASECCARPRGVCFDPALIDGRVSPDSDQTDSLEGGDGAR